MRQRRSLPAWTIVDDAPIKGLVKAIRLNTGMDDCQPTVDQIRSLFEEIPSKEIQRIIIGLFGLHGELPLSEKQIKRLLKVTPTSFVVTAARLQAFKILYPRLLDICAATP